MYDKCWTEPKGSQFFTCTAKTEWLYGKHMVWGKMKASMNIVADIQCFGTRNGKTRKTITRLRTTLVNLSCVYLNHHTVPLVPQEITPPIHLLTISCNLCAIATVLRVSYFPYSSTSLARLWSEVHDNEIKVNNT
jgi:hypothetical protein